MRRLLDSKGFTLIEVLMASAILGMLAVANLTTLLAFLDRNSTSQMKLSILRYKNNIVSSLQSSDALSKTGQAESIPCLVTRQNCSSSSTSYANFSLRDHQGNLLTNAADNNFGFDKEAVTCTTYPSERCPFRYELQWRALCDSPTSCQAPLFQVSAVIRTIPALSGRINPAKYSFTMNIGQIIGTYEQACTSIGGTYVADVPPRCQMPIAGNCPPSQYLTGFDRLAGTKTCRPALWDISCAANEVLLGINSDGTPACRPRRYTCCDGTAVLNISDCPTCPLPCQIDPAPCNTGDGSGGDGDGGCGGDGGGDGCP